MNVLIMENYAICGKMAHLWENVTFLGKCVICGQMCHLWANVTILGKCAIYGQMWHFWANVTLLGKCTIFGQMCHFWANVIFLGKCNIIGQMWHFWANVVYLTGNQTYFDCINAGFAKADSAIASSEYMFIGELNCWLTICFWVPPIFTVFICWWLFVGDIGWLETYMRDNWYSIS